MRQMKEEILIIFAAVTVVLHFSCLPAYAGTWTTMDYPGSYATTIYGIDGSNLVGTYNDDEHAFLYDGSTWTNIDKPGAWRTYATAIDGSNIVGYTWNSYNQVGPGFLYNTATQTWTDLPMWAFGIDGRNIVNGHGVYNLDTQTWTIHDAPGTPPGEPATHINDIEGNILVGDYFDTSYKTHGFLYNMDTQIWTTLDMPGASATFLHGISGSKIVGFGDNSGALYNIDTQIWTTLNEPDAKYGTHIYGIDGDKLVGEYVPGNRHGFVYTIPEPASILMLGMGMFVLRIKYLAWRE